MSWQYPAYLCNHIESQNFFTYQRIPSFKKANFQLKKLRISFEKIRRRHLRAKRPIHNTGACGAVQGHRCRQTVIGRGQPSAAATDQHQASRQHLQPWHYSPPIHLNRCAVTISHMPEKSASPSWIGTQHQKLYKTCLKLFQLFSYRVWHLTNIQLTN